MIAATHLLIFAAATNAIQINTSAMNSIIIVPNPPRNHQFFTFAGAPASRLPSYLNFKPPSVTSVIEVPVQSVVSPLLAVVFVIF